MLYHYLQLISRLHKILYVQDNWFNLQHWLFQLTILLHIFIFTLQIFNYMLKQRFIISSMRILSSLSLVSLRRLTLASRSALMEKRWGIHWPGPLGDGHETARLPWANSVLNVVLQDISINLSCLCVGCSELYF